MGTIQIDGSTPKLTIGNATAEDATILFDGNAQDFYIALDDSADDLLIGLGSTVGTTPIIAIDENKLSTFSGAITVGVDDTGHDVKFFGATASAYMLWDESADDLILAGAAGLTVAGATALNGDVTLGGTTPTLTIGDAGAEDTKIVFDGNAQDYHIGLDDTADSLVIGLGSALGTTTHMSFDATGAVTKPLQPAFLCRPTSNQANLAINTATDVAFATEVFDQNADFSTPSFTAPVAGRYQLSYAIAMMEVDSASYFYFEINTSNRNYTMYHLNDNMLALDGYYAFTASVLADMDASDTAKIVIRQANGTAQADIRTDGSFFSGYLAC
jgi:hypothetical protein